jgi:hypothetical protein
MLFCLLARPTPAAAEASLIISSSGPGEFALFGARMDDIVAMHIFINYDVSTMSNASASATGILLAHGRVTSKFSDGSLEITAAGSEPIGSYGNVVIVNFDPVSDEAPGVINSVSVYVTDSEGRQASLPVVINNPKPRPKDPENQPDRWSAARDAAKAAAERAGTGEGGAPVETAVAPGNPPPGEGARGSAEPGFPGAWAEGARGAGASGKVTVCRSLPDRIGKEGGGKTAPPPSTPADEPDCNYRQEPVVLLSDGKSLARLILKLEVKGDRAPNFLIKGAHCTALKHQVGAWELELMALPGVLEASVSAHFDDRIVQFPLAVASSGTPHPDTPSAHLPAPCQGAGLERIDSLVRSLTEVQP